MKKILLVVTLIASFGASFAQGNMPVNQPIGSINSENYTNGLAGATYGYRFRVSAADTAALNLLYGGVIKTIPGVLARCVNDLYLRSNDASQWIKLASGTISTNYWSKTGDAGTVAGTNFIGSTDSVDFVGKTKSLERFRWNARGAFAVGTGTDYGTSGYFLKSNGVTTAPVWSLPTNIYTSDGTLTGDRVVTQNNHTIEFTGGYFGIGKAPAYDLDVLGTGSGLFTANIANNDINGKGLRLYVDHQSQTYPVLEVNNSAAVLFDVRGNGDVNIPLLSSGASTDSLVTWNATTKTIHKIPPTSIVTSTPTLQLVTNAGATTTNSISINGNVNTASYLLVGNSNAGTSSLARVEVQDDVDISLVAYGTNYTGKGGIVGVYSDDAYTRMEFQTPINIPFHFRNTTGTAARVGINNATPAAELDVVGNALITSPVTAGNGLSVTSSTLTAGAIISAVSTSTVVNGGVNLSVLSSGANSTASKTATGIYSSVTNTGTTSTNIAGVFDAAGASTNTAISVPRGNVNIEGLTASQLVLTDASKNLVSSLTLPNNTLATTQTAGDNSTKVATTAYVATAVASGVTGSGTANTMTKFTGTSAIGNSTMTDDGTTLTSTIKSIFSANGAVSAPVMTLNGTTYSGGSATTTKPKFLIEPTGTTSTGWSTDGTQIGVNAATGFVGNFLDAQVNGTSKFSINNYASEVDFTMNPAGSTSWQFGANAQGFFAYNLTTTGGGTIGYGFNVKPNLDFLIGTITDDASAKLNVVSTTKGLLIPRMTNAQFAAISSPATGLKVYSTDAKMTLDYDGSAYKSAGTVSGSFSQVGTATTTFTVTFGGTQPNATYKVSVVPTAILSAAYFYVSNKTTTTFDVNYLAGLTGTVTFDYSIFQ